MPGRQDGWVSTWSRTRAHCSGRVTAAPGAERHYDSGRALLQDVVDARVWLGFHFRFADLAARDMARQLTAWTLDHYFQPVHGGG